MARSRARVLPPQLWGEHKRYIEKLYLEKRYTLRVVQDKLAKRGFRVSEGQLRTRLKQWGIRKIRRGTVMTVADASSGQNGDNTLMGDASVGGHDGVLARTIVEDDQRSDNAVMSSQPTPEERDHAFADAAIAPEELYTTGPQIAEPPSLRTTYDLADNQARASEAPSGTTGYGLAGNEARASQVPSYSPQYGPVGDEIRTSRACSFSVLYDLGENETQAFQARSVSPRYGLVYSVAQVPPSFEYDTSGNDAQYQDLPFRLQYDTSVGHSGYSQGFSVEQHGETVADDFWNPTEPINTQAKTTSSRYG